MSNESKPDRQRPDDANDFLHREFIVTFRMDSVEDFEATVRTKTISMEGLIRTRKLAHERFVDALENTDIRIEPEYELDAIASFKLEYIHTEDTEAGLQMGFELSACDCVDSDDWREKVAELICKVEPAFTDALRKQGVKLH